MKPRPQISPDTWERLSALREGDLTADEADELTGDPALADARRALDDQISALSAPFSAPAGFADRVLHAVEHEPIPGNNPLWAANRPWWRRVEVALVALAAAAVLVVAIPKPVPVADAPGQIAIPRQPAQEAAPEADPVLP
nr:hypothetical protein [Deltaproteobacteria bacterium]